MKRKLALTVIRTVGAICLIVLGVHACILGFGWHHNMLSEINSEAAFAVVLLLATGGPITIGVGIYGIAPIVFRAIKMALFGETREDHKALKKLKHNFLW